MHEDVASTYRHFHNSDNHRFLDLCWISIYSNHPFLSSLFGWVCEPACCCALSVFLGEINAFHDWNSTLFWRFYHYMFLDNWLQIIVNRGCNLWTNRGRYLTIMVRTSLLARLHQLNMTNWIRLFHFCDIY